MPQLRQNPITKDWVIIATERARRPHEFAKKAEDRPTLPSYSERCPFCPGNEQMTPPETMRLERDGQWQIRVVPNKFSALSREGEIDRQAKGLQRTANGIGYHEVVVETPDHGRNLALLSEDDVERVVQSYKARYIEIAKDPRVLHVTIFKNHGKDAGTSLEHPHSQIIATPVIPPNVRGRMEEALRFYDENGYCLFCQVMQEEMEDGTRIVHQTPHFVCLVPYASLSPFAAWVFPRRHMASFSEIQPEEMRDLAGALRVVLGKLYYGLGDPDYNFIIRTSPCENRYSRHYHWYLSLIPRLTKVAGFELGSGMYINVTLPEANAEFLRGVALPEAAATQESR